MLGVSLFLYFAYTLHQQILKVMSITSKIYTVGLGLALGTFMFSCDQQAVNETDSEATEVRVETQEAAGQARVEVDDEVGEFSAWVDEKASRAESTSEAEWQELKAEYKRREAELDAKSNTWDEKTKQEWRELKDDWKRTEDKVQGRLKRVGDVDVDVEVKKQ